MAWNSSKIKLKTNSSGLFGASRKKKAPLRKFKTGFLTRPTKRMANSPRLLRARTRLARSRISQPNFYLGRSSRWDILARKKSRKDRARNQKRKASSTQSLNPRNPLGLSQSPQSHQSQLRSTNQPPSPAWAANNLRQGSRRPRELGPQLKVPPKPTAHRCSSSQTCRSNRARVASCRMTNSSPRI